MSTKTQIIMSLLFLTVPNGAVADPTLHLPSDAELKECPPGMHQKLTKELQDHPQKDPFLMTDEERRASLEAAIASAPTPEYWRKHPPCKPRQEDKDMAREMPGRPLTPEEMEKQKAAQ
jgi:hypothetical protein